MVLKKKNEIYQHSLKEHRSKLVKLQSFPDNIVRYWKYSLAKFVKFVLTSAYMIILPGRKLTVCWPSFNPTTGYGILHN